MTRRGGSGVDGWWGRLRRPGVGRFSCHLDEGDASVPTPPNPTPTPTRKRHLSLSWCELVPLAGTLVGIFHSHFLKLISVPVQVPEQIPAHFQSGSSGLWPVP